MNLSKEKLEMLQDFAKLPQMTIQDIADILQVDRTELHRQLLIPGTEVFEAFQKGKLLASSEFGKKVTQLSNQGSGPAQTLLSKLKNESEINSMINYYG